MTNGLTNSSSGGSWPDMKGVWLVSSKELSLGHNMDSDSISGSIIFPEGSSYSGYEIVFGSFNSAYGYTDLDAPLKLNIYGSSELDMETHKQVYFVNYRLMDKSGNSLGFKSVRRDSLVGDVVVSISASGMGGLRSFSIDNGETNLLSYTPSGVVISPVHSFKIRYRTQAINWFNYAKLVKSRCKNVMGSNVFYHCYDLANDEYNEYE